MIKEVLLELSPGEVERALYAYQELSDVYEEHYNGPHAAGQFREYIITRQMIRECTTRLNELRRDKNGNGLQD